MLRRVLTVHVLPPEDRRAELSDGELDAVAWLRKSSRPVAALAEGTSVGELLEGLTTNLDGSTAAIPVINRKHAVVHNLFGYAVEREMLAANPLTNLRWKRPKRAGR